MPAAPRSVTRCAVARCAAAAALLAAAVVAGCSSAKSPSGPPTASEQPPASAVPGATPGSTQAPDPAARAAQIVQTMTDEDLVGQVLMAAINLDDPAAGSASLVTKYRVGGVILMGNPPDAAAGGAAAWVRALADRLQTAARGLPAKAPMLVATDQEYGWVTRIKSGVVQLPSAMAFGAAARPDLTEAAWRGAGGELAAAGVNVDFAPDADVIGTPANFIIGSRSYGSDPTGVATQVAAAVRGLQSAGVAATIKHFPGHGHTTADSHSALPVLGQTRKALDSGDLPPFQAGIDAGSWLVMSGHLDVRSIDPGMPASFSHKVLTDLLRTKMRFTGVVVTDALNMAPARRWPPGEAAVRAVLAGNDLLLQMAPQDVQAAQQGLLSALAAGDLPRPRLVEAATRVLTLRFRLAQFAQPALTSVQVPANRDVARAVAAAAITVLRGPCSGPLAHGSVTVTSSAGREGQRAWLVAALKARGVSVVPSGGQVVHLVGYLDTAADLATGAVVTVSMDTPFVLRSASSPVRVATYSATQVAMEALAAVLAGKAAAGGRSPVAVTGLPRSACAV